MEYFAWWSLCFLVAIHFESVAETQRKKITSITAFESPRNATASEHLSAIFRVSLFSKILRTSFKEKQVEQSRLHARTEQRLCCWHAYAVASAGDAKRKGSHHRLRRYACGSCSCTWNSIGRSRRDAKHRWSNQPRAVGTVGSTRANRLGCRGDSRWRR